MSILIPANIKTRKSPILLVGRTYRKTDERAVFICAYDNRLINLIDGSGYAGNRGFDGDDCKFEEVDVIVSEVKVKE